MEKQLEQLMAFRKEIRVVDATLRDGGLCNDFYFTDEFARALYQTNKKAGVDIMEFGYKASKDMFDESKFGPWKFCDDEAIRRIVGEKEGGPEIAVMADVGRTDFRRDILPKDESPIDMIRVACYIHQIPGAIEMIEDAKKKGYKTSCNIMAISTNQEADIRVALNLLGQSPVDVIYIVDSYGSLYPEAMERLCDVYKSVAHKYGKELGIHAHNNMQMAFANTAEACGDGINYLDATYNGMGRGAGNCAMELLLGFLRNPKYREYEVFRFIQDHIIPLKEQGVVWGYDLQYLATGLLNQHPRSAIAFTKDGRKDYGDFYHELINID
ncbi:MAG: aldolase catalytic domain-containing protein [Lachnospiraceae bacterium]|nr:aldolase catalytic domain-containing protein [Lachnospiraceae bacterium]